MELIHQSKFEQKRKATSAKQRSMLNELKMLYPFAVADIIATENNLEVLYNNKEIAILLNKLVGEQDAAKKEIKRKGWRHKCKARKQQKKTKSRLEKKLQQWKKSMNLRLMLLRTCQRRLCQHPRHAACYPASKT